jgi:hypothetical protein
MPRPFDGELVLMPVIADQLLRLEKIEQRLGAVVEISATAGSRQGDMGAEPSLHRDLTPALDQYLKTGFLSPRLVPVRPENATATGSPQCPDGRWQ